MSATSIIKRHKDSKGFTLTELLAVMAILGILAGLVTGAIVGLGTRGQEARLEGDRETIRKAANQFSVEAFPEVFPVVELAETDPSIVPATDIGVRLIDFKARLPQDPTKKFVPDFLSTLPGSSALVSWRIDTRSGNVFFASNGADLILPSSNRLDIAASDSEVSAISDYTFELSMAKNEAAVDTLEIRIPAGYSLGGQFAPADSLMGVLKITLDTDNEADSGQQVHLGGVLVATGEANKWSLVVNYNDNVSTSGSTDVDVKLPAEAVRVHTVTIVPPSGTSAGSLTLDMDRGSDDAENKATEIWELTILGSATKDLSAVLTVPSTSPSPTGGIDSAARSIDTTDGFAVTGGGTLSETVNIVTNPSTAAVKRWLSEENTSIDPEIGTARFFNTVAGDQGVLIKDAEGSEGGGTLPPTPPTTATGTATWNFLLVEVPPEITFNIPSGTPLATTFLLDAPFYNTSDPASTPLLGLALITVLVDGFPVPVVSVDTDAGTFSLLFPILVGSTVEATFEYSTSP